MFLESGIFPSPFYRESPVWIPAPGGGGGGITLVASTAKAGPTTDAIDTTGANLIVFGIVTSDGQTVTASDNKGNSWTLSPKSGNGWMQAILAYSVPSSVGSGHTFTISGGSAESCFVAAFSGANASPFDQQNGAAFSGSLPPAYITPTVDNSLIVALLGVYSDDDIEFGGQSPNLLISSFYGGAMHWFIQGAAATTTEEWTFTNNVGNPSSRIANFKPA